jgi:hypothetical protein
LGLDLLLKSQDILGLFEIEFIHPGPAFLDIAQFSSTAVNRETTFLLYDPINAYPPSLLDTLKIIGLGRQAAGMLLLPTNNTRTPER